MSAPINQPNLFIVGAVKCATTSLHAWLSLHPDVFMSSVKEPHYYAQVTQTPEHRNFEPVVTQTNEYHRLFTDAGDTQVIGEASPSYLQNSEAAARIHADCPDARIVISLRDPVERAHSHYLMEHRAGRESLSFADAIESDARNTDRRWGHAFLYQELGLYHDAVKRYLDQFGEDQVRIILFDDIRATPQTVFDELCTFLSIEAHQLSETTLSTALNPYEEPRSALARQLNRNAWVRMFAKRFLPVSLRRTLRDTLLFRRSEKPVLDTDVQTQLQQFYHDDVAALESLLDRPLPQLRRSWNDA